LPRLAHGGIKERDERQSKIVHCYLGVCSVYEYVADRVFLKAWQATSRYWAQVVVR